ncbi:GMC family oxidoreductase N-terminal domain-containing protein, partial [Siccirubricoccus sp. KC 17139]
MLEPIPGADSFDYVIVGAGAAGCVLANRLTADGRTTVCVLEAGPPDRSPWIHIPAGFIKTRTDRSITWQFHTEPTEMTAGRRIHTVQGRTLGGSSSINGMIYNRGQPADLDNWAQRGNRGWSYADCLPYYRRSERRIGAGDDTRRGRDGDFAVTDNDWIHPLSEAFIEGCVGLGIPRNPDYNSGDQAGVGYYQRAIRNGIRVSAARAFLHPAMSRRNLEVRTEARASAILFEGRRAIGVQYLHAPGAPPRRVMARREVIVSAGTVNTARLLQVSGIG